MTRKGNGKLSNDARAALLKLVVMNTDENNKCMKHDKELVELFEKRAGIRVTSQTVRVVRERNNIRAFRSKEKNAEKVPAGARSLIAWMKRVIGKHDRDIAILMEDLMSRTKDPGQEGGAQ